MKKLIYISIVLSAVCWTTACKHVDEEPDLNQGYDTQFRVPDAETLTADDSAFVEAQKAEYELNAK